MIAFKACIKPTLKNLETRLFAEQADINQLGLLRIALTAKLLSLKKRERSIGRLLRDQTLEIQQKSLARQRVVVRFSLMDLFEKPVRSLTGRIARCGKITLQLLTYLFKLAQTPSDFGLTIAPQWQIGVDRVGQTVGDERLVRVPDS